MNAARLAVAIVLVTGTLGQARQAPNLVTEVRAAIAKQDFAEGERLIEAHRASAGVTPIAMEALSWLGRGALAAGQIDKADAYAQRSYGLILEALKTKAVDDDPRLATALGASIEVMAQAGAKRGARSEAVAFLRQELDRWGATSIRTRIQKNLNLLSLEGTAAPALDLAEHVGPNPPALAALKGKVVLLFFWAHWCGDCKAQAPVLARLLERYRDAGLTIIAPTQRYGYVAGGRKATPERGEGLHRPGQTGGLRPAAGHAGPDRAGQPRPLRREHDADARHRRPARRGAALQSWPHDRRGA